MTNSPHSQHQPEPTSRQHKWLKLLKRTSLTLGVIVLAGGAAGAAYALYFIQNELSPLVSTQLTKLVQRPVDVGPVESFSLSGIKLGTSILPATPTDPDTATIKAVEVEFDLWKFLRTRTLGLDVKLIEPDLYLEQSPDGAWLETQLNPGDEEPGPIQIQVDRISFVNGQLVLIANPQLRAEVLGLETIPPAKIFSIQDLEGRADFFDDQTRVAFNVEAKPTRVGQLKVSGESVLTTLETKLRIQGQDLYGPDVIPLIPNLPLAMYAGRLDANLLIELQETELLGWQGTAGFSNVTGKLGGLPKTLTEASGRLRFSGLKVGLEDAIALYGQIPATAEGVIDTGGDGEYNLAVDIKPVSVENFLETLEVEPPIPLAGELAGELKVTGPLAEPFVVATVANTEIIQVDKVDFSTVRASVAIDVTAQSVQLKEFVAQPVAGGQIVGSGNVPLEPKEAIALTFEASNIPGDAIAQNYLEDPLPIAIGSVDATAKITGSPENPTTLVQWQLPEATYPGQGEVIVLGETIVVPNTRFQIAGGTLSANGSLVDEQWRAFITAEGVELDRLALPGQSPFVPVEGTLQAKLTAQGTLEPEADKLEAVARISIDTVRDGSITANASLNEGQWQATVRSSELELARFVPNLPVPVQLPSAELNIAGTLDSLEPENLEATATAQLAIPGAVVRANAIANEGQFRVTATTEGLGLNRFVPEQLPVDVAIADARVNLVGSLDALELDAIDATTQVNLNVAGNPINANATLSNGQLQALVNADDVPLDPFLPQDVPVPVTLARGRVRVSGNIDALDPNDLFATTQLQLNVAGNPITASGRLRDGQLLATVSASGVPLDPFVPQELPVPVTLAEGRVNLSGNIDSFEQFSPEDLFATTQLRFNVAGSPVTASGRLINGEFQAFVNTSGVPLNPFVPQDLPVQAIAEGQAVVTGSLESFEVSGVNARAQLDLNVDGADVNAIARVRSGNLQATLTADELQLNRFVPGDVLPVPVELARGQVNLSGNLNQLSLSTIDATTRLQLNVASGTVIADGRVRNGDLQATVRADEVLLSRFAPQLPVPVTLDRGRVNLSGNIAELDPTQLNATAQLQLDVANAEVSAQGRLRNGDFQAILTSDRVPVSPFAPELPSTLEIGRGRVTVQGNIAAFEPSAIDATAQVQLAIASGTLNANAIVENGQFEAAIAAAELQLNQFTPQLPAPVELARGQARVRGNLSNLDLAALAATTQFQLQTPEGRVNADATLTNGDLQAVATASGVQVNAFADLPVPVIVDDGRFTVSGNITSLDPTDLNATARVQLLVADAAVSGSGQLQNGDFQATVISRDIPVNQFAPNLPTTLEIGSGRLTVSGNIAALDPDAIAATTQLQLEIAEGTVSANATLRNGQIQAFLNASGIDVNQFAPDLPVPVQLASAEATVQGDIATLEPTTLDATTDLRLLVADSEVVGSGRLQNGAFLVSLVADDLDVNQFAPDLQVPVQVAQGRVTVEGNLASLDPNEIDATARVQLALAEGGNLNGTAGIDNGQIQAFLSASELRVNRFAPDLPVLVVVDNADVAVSGNLAELDPSNFEATGEALLQVAGGRVSTDFGLNDGSWRALVTTQELPLNAFVPNLQEPLQLTSGAVNLSGTIDSFALEDVTANGDVELVLASLAPDSPLSPFASSISPLTSSFRWNGETLQVRQIDAPGLNASGEVFVAVEGPQAPQVTGFDFNLELNDFNLAGLPLPVESLPPIQTAEGEEVLPYIAGAVNFAGQIQGTLPPPNAQLPFDITVVGDVRLEDFAIATLDFEPVLAGPVRVNTGEGVTIDIRGERDAIAVELNENFFPESFLIRQGEAIARGNIENNVLNFAIEEFPLGILNVALPQEPGPVAGSIYSSGQFNLNTNVGSADIEIVDPRIGYINANGFVGQVSYNDGVVVLDEGILGVGESEYLIEARAVIDDDPNFQGRIAINKGRVEDILQALALFTVADLQRGLIAPEYAPPEAVDPIAVGLPQSPLIAQLRRFSEITTLVQQNAITAQAPGIPELANIQGRLGGEITFAGSVETGASVNFDIQGDELKWFTQRPYQTIVNNQVVLREGRTIDINQVIIRGSFENGVVTFLPLRVEAEDSLIAFTGTIGGENQSAQLRVANFPVSLIQQFVELPPNFSIDGIVNLRATLAGSLENPQARGEIALADGTVNGEDVPTVRGSFSYASDRLNFSSVEPASLQVTASVPVPPAPGNDAISLDVNIENEGLTLINVVTAQQVEWVNGTGQVRLEARGNLNAETGAIEALVATGIATFENATIDAQALPAPLTNVTGTARFETDRIIVEGIQGDFSEGLVLAEGVLPIFNPLGGSDPNVANPLTIALDDLEINLKGLYDGDVDGRIVITGSALEPQIGGEILVSNGEVLLPTGEEAQTAAAASSENDAPAAEQEAGAEFNDLRVILGDDLEITSPPLLSFLAEGDLTINGFLDDLRPRGTIRLVRGQVNLFTTQFRLARGYDNEAVFTGLLDPYLDVRLVATVPEVTNTKQVTTASSSEVTDAIETDIGSVETVRVVASVSGPASQLSENLELTSSPARTEQEIVALIGGGFINTFRQGNTTLALANIAGNTLLSDVQYAIANALGLSEFRLSPALVKEGSADRLALEVEAGVDITRNFSVSLERILVDDMPTQFNVRYRINEEVLLRGSTDFDEDHRGLIQYEIRF